MPAAIAIPLIVAGVSAGASVGTAVYQSKQNEKATRANLSAADRAAALESSNFDKSILAAQDEQDYNRWLTSETAKARQPYLDQLMASIGGGGASFVPQTYQPGFYEAAKPFVEPNAADLEKDPGFQFEREQGLNQLTRGAAASGTALTGGADKDRAAYAEGLASTRNSERINRALSEYSLSESLRASTFDRNEAAKLNAVNVNNQGAYNAASLANQGFGNRLSALSSLASLALPTGQYPGRREGDQHTLPVNQFGVPLPQPTPGAPTFVGGVEQGRLNPTDIGNGYAPTDPTNLYGDENDTPWAGALNRRKF